MKMENVAIAARYVKALKRLPAARGDAKPGRGPGDYYVNGLAISYYEGDQSGGESGHRVLLPLEAAKKVLDFVESLCRRRLEEPGVSDG